MAEKKKKHVMERCLRAGMYDSKYKRFFHSVNNSHTAISGKDEYFNVQ